MSRRQIHALDLEPILFLQDFGLIERGEMNLDFNGSGWWNDADVWSNAVALRSGGFDFVGHVVGSEIVQSDCIGDDAIVGWGIVEHGGRDLEQLWSRDVL